MSLKPSDSLKTDFPVVAKTFGKVVYYSEGANEQEALVIATKPNAGAIPAASTKLTSRQLLLRGMKRNGRLPSWVNISDTS